MEPNEIRFEIGRRIKRGRKAKKLNQRQLADLVGWGSQSRISNYERGDREPEMADLQRLAKHIELDFADLVNPAGLRSTRQRCESEFDA